MTMDVLEIRDFTKSYGGGEPTVENLSLTVRAGDIFGFIGHNGAGKSTTIRSIVGVQEFEGGDIFVCGRSVRTESLEARRCLAYIPDNPDLYEHLTGEQYLNFIADVFSLTAEERRERIALYTGKFEITDALGSLISSYSHGMKQKLALCSALIHEPKLMVLDEPFVGLDPKAALTLKNCMHELCEKGGAVFFSTHVLDVAEKLCNRIAIIKKGRLVAQGDTETLVGDSTLEDVFMEVIDHDR